MKQRSQVKKMSVSSKIQTELKSRLCAIVFLAFVAASGLSAQQNVIQQMVNAVSSDSMMKTVLGLQAFGTRYEFTAQRDSAATYLLKEFARQGLMAESDPYVFGTEDYNDIAVIDQQRMVIVGGDSLILTTSDGGATWRRSSIPAFSQSFYTFTAVCFVKAQLGWAVGNGGTIIHTTDGGSTWSEQFTIVSNDFNDISFADERFGVIVGTNGVVLRTANGGATWLWSVPTSRTLRGVTALDSLNVWAVGDSATILRSTNGGVTWSNQKLNVTDASSYPLYSVDFYNSQLGWAVSSWGIIARTSDGGATWAKVPRPFSGGGDYRSVCSNGVSSAWLMDRSGYILNTTNNGTSWEVAFKSPSAGWGSSFQKMGVSRTDRVAVCGTDGIILTSQDDGKTWIEQTANVPRQLLHHSRNIVATLPGLVTPGKEIVIVAHYDSYDGWEDAMLVAPGANDNGSGTSAVLEAARICRNYQFESSIRFLAVSAEELGMIGSTHYVSEAVKKGSSIIAAVNGDMLGYPTTSDTARLAIGSYLSRNRLVDSALVYNQRYKIGLTLAPFVDGTAASDYAPFAVAGIDALEVAEGTPNDIWGGKDPYYHKPSDTADKLKPSLLRQAAQLMLATIAELARPVAKPVLVNESANPPREFALHQNYPNPFNPSTVIKIQLPAQSIVALKIFDPLGREVAEVFRGVKSAGTYTATWNASDMPSGVYFYRLFAQPLSGGRGVEFVQTKRMIFIK